MSVRLHDTKVIPNGDTSLPLKLVIADAAVCETSQITPNALVSRVHFR